MKFAGCAVCQEELVEENAIQMLDSCSVMAISTVRPDGWPQTTIVGYANDALAVYFLIFRSSQKFSNLQHDNRVSIAVSDEPKDIYKLTAVYAGAHAIEVTDPQRREGAWQLLMKRHPNLADFELPEISDAAVMRADCEYVSVLDYSKGLGHTDALIIGAEDAAPTRPSQSDDSGSSAAQQSSDQGKSSVG